MYKASSAAIGVSGLLFVAAAPVAHEHVSAVWPWRAFGVLWALQGLLSWKADVANIGRTSVYHVLDMQLSLASSLVLALYALGFFFGQFRFHLPPLAIRIGALLLFCLAVFAKLQSGAAAAKG